MVQKQQDILINPLFLFKDYNECEQQNICEHNGTCINNNGSYVCDCTDGWKGKHCSDGRLFDKTFKRSEQFLSCAQYQFVKFIFVDVDECEITELCKHNGTCINNNGSYICNCTDGWQGQHCEYGQYKVIFKIKLLSINEKLALKIF